MTGAPRTWEVCEDELANDIFSTVVIEAANFGYHYFGSRRLWVYDDKTTYGQCRSTVATKGDCYSFIGINRKCLKSRNVLFDVLVHELAHAICPKDHHGKKWKEVGNQIGQRLGVTVTRDNTEEYEREGVVIREPVSETVARYIIECPCCHATWKYNRLCKTVKYAELYRCCKCKTDLVRIK